ncbi:hypothetical protein GCM10009648_02290 [Tsukamurella spumae]
MWSRVGVALRVLRFPAPNGLLARGARLLALVWWVLRGHRDRLRSFSIQDQLAAATRKVRSRKRAQRLLWSVVAAAIVAAAAGPGLRLCRDRWPQGTSEVLHSAWTLVTSPGFGTAAPVGDI